MPAQKQRALQILPHKHSNKLTYCSMKQQSQCIQSNKEHTKLKHQTRKMEEQEKEMMEEKKRDPPQMNLNLRSANHVREDFQSPAKYGYNTGTCYLPL